MFHLLLAALWTTPALGETPTVAVPGLHQSSLTTEEQAAGAAKIARAIRKLGYEPLSSDELAGAISGREGVILKEAFLGPGRKQLEDGRDLYQQAAFEDAEEVLFSAIDTLTLGMGSANSGNELWEAWTLLGTIRVMNDNQPAARDAFANAIALNPARSPNPAQFPPDALALYSEVRSDLTAVSSILRIKSDEEDVQVFVNGDPKGTAPLTIREIVPGINHIVARGTGGSHAYKPVDVPDAGDEVVFMRMGEPTLGSGARTPFARSRQTGTLYRSFGEHSGVDLILLSGTTEETVLVQLYSPRTESFCVPVETEYTGATVDETLESIPELFRKVKDNGTFYDSQLAPLAVPLDVGSNKLLAAMLLSPEASRFASGKKGVPLWAVGAGGAAIAAIVTGAVIVASRSGEPVQNGSITVLVD